MLSVRFRAEHHLDTYRVVTRRFAGHNPSLALRVAVLDSFQGILDGYHFRFDPLENITIVVEARTAADFDAGLAGSQADVALMELHAPVSAENPSPYAVLHVIPRLLERFPDLAVVIFSSHANPYQINSVVDAGARGYIVKDDSQIYPVLPQLLATVYQGGTYYSPTAQTALRQIDAQPGARGLLGGSNPCPGGSTRFAAKEVGTPQIDLIPRGASFRPCRCAPPIRATRSATLPTPWACVPAPPATCSRRPTNAST